MIAELMKFTSEMYHRGTFWSLPVSLKEKLSSSWTVCLEMLANSSFFTLRADMFRKGRKSSTATDDMTFESWESVLSILGEEEAVEQGGEVKLLPIFLSLPLVLQLRFLHFLNLNILRVSSHSVSIFLQRIDNLRNNLWVREVIQQIRSCASLCCPEDGQLKEQINIKYEFTSVCQKALEDISNALRNGGKMSSHSLQEQLQASSVQKSERRGSEDSLGIEFPASVHTSIKSSTQKHHPDGERIEDVIIIDDDSMDHPTIIKNHTFIENVTVALISNNGCMKLSDVSHCDKSCDKTSNSQKVNSTNKDKNIAGDKYGADINDIASSEAALTVSSVTCDKSVKDLNRKERKRKQADVIAPLDSRTTVKQQKLLDEIVEMETSAPVEVESATENKLVSQPSGEIDSGFNLGENVMAYLDIMRDACSNTEKDFVVDKDVMNCFKEMSAAKAKATCSYLDLPHFSEVALVNFCDNIPWVEMGNEVSEVLLNSCFSFKLKNMESPASRTLMISLNSVSRIQPKALINVLCRVLQASQSGEFQCQVVISLCKDLLPPDSLCYLVRQFTMEGLHLSENLAGVLQVITDKCTELDTHSWSCFHSLLTSGGCEELSTSAKFGKLLMGVFTKYTKKMSSQQFITLCALAESHRSSLRKPLLAVIRRCQ